ncbi:MAG: TolC family protein [Planctomycetes bacterium]|nr:TolC family protein [Planctomycetota bacterium]
MIPAAAASAVLFALPPALAPAVLRQDPPSAAADLYGAGKGLEVTLEGACELALQQNLGLASEALNTDLALFNYRGSYGTFDWLFHAGGAWNDTKGQPQSVFGGENVNTQSGNLDFTRLFDTGGTFKAAFSTANTKTNSTITTFNPSTHDLVSLTYTQPILRGAWREYNTAVQREAELTWRQQMEKERAARQKLLLDVSNAYWDLVAARDDLEVKTSGVDLAKAQVDQEQRRLDAGVGTRLDVLQAETQVATREQERLLADVKVRAAADKLRALLFAGRDRGRWETAILPKTPLPDEARADDTPSWTSALDVALDHRASLREQRLTIDIMALRHELRRSDKRPNLSLELGATGEGFSGDTSTSLDDAFSYNYPTLSAKINYSIPIGNRTARWALEAAWVNLRKARLDYDQLESNVAAEVREAVRQVLYQAESVRAARKSMDLAREQLKAEEARRQVEITTNFQVLKFQQDLVAALSSERAARANFAKALVALKDAQGILGDRP